MSLSTTKTVGWSGPRSFILNKLSSAFFLDSFENQGHPTCPRNLSQLAVTPCAPSRNLQSARPETGRTQALASTRRTTRAHLRVNRLRSVGRKQSHRSTIPSGEKAWIRSSSTAKRADPTPTAPGRRTPVMCTTMSRPTATGCKRCLPTATAGGRCR